MSNRTELVAKLATRTGTSNAAADVLLTSVTAELMDQLATKGEAVLPGFGRFRLDTRSARQGRNPKTGESIQIPERQVVKFKVFPSVSVEAVPPEVNTPPSE